MSKLTPQKFNRISQYIKMYEGDRETLQFAWANTWDDESMEDYYDLDNFDIQTTITDLRILIDAKENRLKINKKLLNECEAIYQQWILINGKIISNK
jgi:hypothetical protein